MGNYMTSCDDYIWCQNSYCAPFDILHSCNKTKLIETKKNHSFYSQKFISISLISELNNTDNLNLNKSKIILSSTMSRVTLNYMHADFNKPHKVFIHHSG